MNVRRATRATPVVVVVAVTAALVATLAFRSVGEQIFTPSPNTAKVTINSSDSLRVSFIGDSIDAGFYASDQHRGFHSLVVDDWRTSGPVADFPMRALAGGTAADVLTNRELPADQQLYIVELGTNDASRVDYHQFRNDYSELLNRLLASSDDPALVCLGVWRPKVNAETFDLIIKDQCEIRGGVFVGLSDLAGNELLKGPAGIITPNGMSDDFHPNDLGHREIADRVLAAIDIEREG